MQNLGDQLKRKINIRNMAINNLGREETVITQNLINENANDDIEKLHHLLIQNINEADESSFQNGYWYISGKKTLVFIKKVLRKLVRIFYGWFLFPILSRQSHFNGKTVNSLNLLKDMVVTQEQIINKLRSDYNSLEEQIHLHKLESSENLYSHVNNLNQELMELVNDKFNEMQKQIDSNNQTINNSYQQLINQQEVYNSTIQIDICELKRLQQDKINEMEQVIESIDRTINCFQSQLAPDLRLDVSGKNIVKIEALNDYELHGMIQTIENASTEEIEDKLRAATISYRNLIQNKINKQDIMKHGIIVILCLRFRDEYGMEAIKNEAYDLFSLLQNESKYNIKLVSLEQAVEDTRYSDSIIYVDEENIGECLNQLSPKLIIMCESTPHLIFNMKGLLFKYHTLIKLTGQNPLQGLNEKALEELVHSSDYGVHRYIVESQKSYDIMVENGFRNVMLSYPIINIDRILINKEKHFVDEKFVVGFASLPMKEDQFDDRGLNIFIDVIQRMPDIVFKVLWRNETLKVPEKLMDAKNCELFFGKYDMKLFYQEIDCLIVPYKTINNNHACSLSGLEAMLNNIPVLCTSVSGISEIVNATGLGIVSLPNSDELAANLYNLFINYKRYLGHDKIQQLFKMIDTKQITYIIEGIAEEYFPKDFITLEEWNYYLKEEGRYLVKGHNTIKEYYQNINVANNYNETRFLLYPGNYYDSFERASIGIIIENLFSDKIDILDIASGDGRIVQEDVKYGFCTSVDSSRAMLDIVEKRYKSLGLLKTVMCDYFLDDIEGVYDVVTTFRYIRHYDYVQRKILYQRIHNNLKDGGILIFDVPNIKYIMNTRNSGNWGDFNIYDVFWDDKSIVRELEENKFEVKYLIPIGVKSIDKDPVSWTVAAMKK